MENPRPDPDFEYDDDYDSYYRSELTGVGLPPSQLALIIGVNAVISLIISVVVVLIANRQVVPGDIATASVDANTTSSETIEAVEGDTPPAAAENTPAAVTTPVESVTYEVQAGDTLGAIADKFSVSLFDLMSANGLSNQDFIQVGQVLTIPLGGPGPATPTFTPVPIPTDTPLPFDPPTPIPEGQSVPVEPAVTVGPSPTPTETPTLTATLSIAASTPTPLPTSTAPPLDEINVVINEVLGNGTLSQETLVILNQGAGTSLRDWKLEGSSLGIFVFPDIFLFSGGSIRVHTAAGQNTPSDLFLNQGESAWPPGTTIILRDENNSEISRYTVPITP